MSFAVVPNLGGKYDVWYTSNLATRFFPANSVPTVQLKIWDPEPGLLAPPQINSIRFDVSLTKIFIEFDAPTNADTSLQEVPCEMYIIAVTGNEFGNGGTESCSWLTSQSFQIRLGYGATARPGSTLSLQDDVVIAQCEIFDAGGSCLNKRRPIERGSDHPSYFL